MEKDRGTRVLAILAICVAIVGMTVGFASFSTVLNIEGTGTVKASNWSVIFENLQNVVINGTAEEDTTPTIQTGSTTISNYAVILKTPGDSISYTFDIKNEGTYDAKINSIIMAGQGTTPFVVTGSGENKTTDETNVKDNLTYTLKYVTVYDGAINNVVAGNGLAVNDLLPAGKTVTVKLTLTYDSFDNEALLPKEDVTIDNLAININYGQVTE